MNPYQEKIYNQITADLAQGMFKILNDFPGHEAEVARLMAAQLGSFIAVTSKKPQEALIFYANRLAHFDWQTVRTDYFANTLGVTNTRPASSPQPLAEVLEIGRENGNPVRPEEPLGTQTGSDPAAEKPR